MESRKFTVTNGNVEINDNEIIVNGVLIRIDENGNINIIGDVNNVNGNIGGYVIGDVGGYVSGNVSGIVLGKINGKQWRNEYFLGAIAGYKAGFAEGFEDGAVDVLSKLYEQEQQKQQK